MLFTQYFLVVNLVSGIPIILKLDVSALSKFVNSSIWKSKEEICRWSKIDMTKFGDNIMVCGCTAKIT